MSGMPLNPQLTEVGATMVGPMKTAAVYRMYDIGEKPALIRQNEGQEGFELEVELWDVPLEGVGAFMQCASSPWRPCASSWALHCHSCTHKLFIYDQWSQNW